MAIARSLNVYKDTYQLVKMLMQCQRTFDKQFKYTLGADIQHESLQLFGCIQRANMFIERRVEYLEDFTVRFETLVTLLRLAYDFHQIDQKRQAAIYSLVERI